MDIADKDDRLLTSKEAEVFIAQLAYQEYQELKGIDEKYKALWTEYCAVIKQFNSLLESYKALHESYHRQRKTARSASKRRRRRADAAIRAKAR